VVVILLFLNFSSEQPNKFKETALPRAVAVFGPMFGVPKSTEQIGRAPNICCI
jgi:hypothetical protein